MHRDLISIYVPEGGCSSPGTQFLVVDKEGFVRACFTRSSCTKGKKCWLDIRKGGFLVLMIKS